jgi:hypothetical protein
MTYDVQKQMNNEASLRAMHPSDRNRESKLTHGKPPILAKMAQDIQQFDFGGK